MKKEVEKMAEEYLYDDGITNILWFPDSANKEIRLVLLANDLEDTVNETHVVPYYFPITTDELPYVSAIAIIDENKVNKLTLPDDWCSWENAKEMK